MTEPAMAGISIAVGYGLMVRDTGAADIEAGAGWPETNLSTGRFRWFSFQLIWVKQCDFVAL